MTVWTQLINEIEGFTNEIRDLPIIQNVTSAEIRAELETRYDFDKPIPLETLTEDVSRLLRKWNLHVTHPRYFGLFNPSVCQSGVVADVAHRLGLWFHVDAAWGGSAMFRRS